MYPHADGVPEVPSNTSKRPRRVDPLDAMGRACGSTMQPHLARVLLIEAAKSSETALRIQGDAGGDLTLQPNCHNLEQVGNEHVPSGIHGVVVPVTVKCD